MKNKHEIWISAIPYAIIAVIIFIFNIISIWGFDGLLTDDQAYYFRLYNKSIGDIQFKRNIVHAIYTLGIIKIAVFTSVFFARLLIVLLLSIPGAFLVYYFSHYQFKLQKTAAVTIAVLPFILPNEILVPTYMAGSYMLLAIIFGLISIFFILKFSKREEFSVTHFMLAVTFYFLATESSELIAVMLPVFLFLIFLFRKLTLKQILLAICLSFIAIRKAILIIQKPHGLINNVSNDLPFSAIRHRIINFLDFINPLQGMTNIIMINIFLNILLVSIVIGAAIIVLRNHKRLNDILDPNLAQGKPKNKYFHIAYFYLLPGMWLTFSIIPFLFYSHHFSSRYFQVASIAISFLFVTSISVIAGKYTNRKMPVVSVLVLLIAFSGFNRQVNFKKHYRHHNKQFNSIKHSLATCNLPENVQIVVVMPKDSDLEIGKGYTRNSTGVLQYILNRRDVDGQIMMEKCFYDPFQLPLQPQKYPNAGVDTTKYTCLIRSNQEDSIQNKRMHYALRWVDDKRKDSPWSIFHFDEQGIKTNLTSGIGYNSYEMTLDSLSATGIKRDDIMFGGIPTSKDSLRLGL